jgi:hypothetical protein
MASLAMLRAQFPEANGVSDVLCATMLAAAALELDTSVWGKLGLPGGLMTVADQAQLYLSMHKLAISPFGQNAKMMVDPRKRGYDRTTYGSEFRLMMTARTGGFRVA